MQRSQRLGRQETTTSNHVLDTALDVVETHGAAALALEVVDEASERGELLAATTVGAVVQRLLVYVSKCRVSASRRKHGAGMESNFCTVLTNRRHQVVVQTVESAERLVADIEALITMTVPGPVGGEGQLGRTVPLEDVVGQLVVGVVGANKLEHGIAVHVAGLGAARALDVLSQVGGGVEGTATEGALDAEVDVGTGLPVLDFSRVSARAKQGQARRLAEVEEEH